MEKRLLVFVVLFFATFVFAFSLVSANNIILDSSSILDDAYVDGGSGQGNKNFGLTPDLKIQRNPYQRVYIKFDISQIPRNHTINNSKLCLYLYDDSGSQTISASHVYVNDWKQGSLDNDDASEQTYKTNITWNNQPCGVDLDNSSACNLTAESSLTNDGSLDGTWQCWNIVNAVSKEYNSENKNVSIILYTEDFGNADVFYSKEYTENVSLRPYLNMTYYPLINETYVDDDFNSSVEGWGVTHFKNITDALNIVQEGGKVYVASGIYNEKLVVDKSVELIGSGWETTTINGGGSEHVITINSNYVNISGFKIIGSGTNWGNAGIYYLSGGYSVIEENYFLENDVGISLTCASPGNMFRSNYVINSSRWGLYTNYWGTQDNLIYNNYFDNSDNFYAASSPPNFGFFNITKTSGTNIVGGSYIGGNFWSDYSGSNRGDGFGDTSYNVQGSYYDYLPLVEISAPILEIFFPESKEYFHTEPIGLNYSVYDLDDDLDSCWYNLNNGENITLTNCQNTTLNLFPGDYNLFLYANDSAGYLTLESVSFNVTNTAPIVNLFEPLNGNTYGYNESIPLKFSITDNEGDLDSCWYNLDNEENQTINCYQNTTFNVPTSGNYLLNIYSNDSLGELGFDSASFGVDIGAPIIILHSPINVYLNNGTNVEFSYTPSDFDLDYCELWGDFDGEFKLVETDLNPSNGFENNFILNLTDGVYTWNIRCQDQENNSAFNGNQTFYVDTLNPNITLIEPKGTKTSRTNIPLTFNVIDNSPITCVYNVYLGDALHLSNRTINCSSTTLNVSADGNFLLNFYVNDSAGNFANKSSAFSVDTSSTPPNPPSGGNTGSSGGGGGGYVPQNKTVSGFNNLEISGVSDLVLESGKSKNIVLNVRNAGINFLNSCKLVVGGNFSEWLKINSGIENLASGEKKVFDFDLEVPSSGVSGENEVSLVLECQETSEDILFVVDVVERKLGFNLVEVKKQSANLIKVDYSIEELSGTDQTVNLEFLLFDSNNVKVAEKIETLDISANAFLDSFVEISIEDYVEGELNLLVNLNSEVYSTFVQENVFLGRTTGLAIFGEGRSSENILTALVVIAFLVFAFFSVKRMVLHNKKMRKYFKFSRKKK